ncbi:MAG: hypothetical protein QOI34_821 [Verrucomicrobiota bacterium]
MPQLALGSDFIRRSAFGVGHSAFARLRDSPECFRWLSVERFLGCNIQDEKNKRAPAIAGYLPASGYSHSI